VLWGWDFEVLGWGCIALGFPIFYKLVYFCGEIMCRL
jgi:hypothetical protein